MMKTMTIGFIMVFLLGSVQNGQAQIFKKLKERLTGEETKVPTEMTSGHEMKFEGWSLGNADIVAISVFSDDFDKHRKNVGTIHSDGSFDINMPDSLKTWVSVSVYGKDCENSADAVIENPKVKLAWNRLWVFQKGTSIAEIIPANSFKAAFNLNKAGVNNGILGKYFLWVYADGDASATINCTKVKEITDGKETTYPKMPLKDNFDLHYKKGWNIVEVHNLDNIWVGRTKHYTEREWRVVEELPQDAEWVLMPIDR